MNPAKPNEIVEVEVLPKSLINAEIESPLYMDALKFEISSKENLDITEMVRNFFNAQSPWFLALMINTIAKNKLEKSLRENDFSQGSKVGHWTVSNSNKTEIIFRESLGFIEHRLSFCKVDNNSNTFRTMSSVKTHNKLGSFYFFFVKRVHMKLVKFAIRNMLRE